MAGAAKPERLTNSAARSRCDATKPSSPHYCRAAASFFAMTDLFGRRIGLPATDTVLRLRDGTAGLYMTTTLVGMSN
jgi:hypothetical protein